MQSPFASLIAILKKFPAVGSKSAQRLAFYLFSMSEGSFEELVRTVRELKRELRYCSVCANISKTDPCHICSDQRRDAEHLCLVAEQKDLLAIEKTGKYHGQYHILGGLISPLDGIYPEMLRLPELWQRLEQGKFQEIILAINPTVEGEATIIYLSKYFQKYPIKVTRIAYGLPMGSDLDYVDETTVLQAFEGRKELIL